MAQRNWRFKVRASDRDLGGLFDMMRYDRARVLTWDRFDSPNRAEHNVFILYLESPQYPTVDRWASFLIGVNDIQEVPW